MRAILMHEFGDENVLTLREVADPDPGAGEALVRVGAVEVSRTRDVATRTGLHPFSRQVKLPHVLGGDFAGVVEAVGPGVDPDLVGRRVAASCTTTCGACEPCLRGHSALCGELEMLGIHRWGSYAELARVPVANLTEIPSGLSMTEAAAYAATGPIALTQLTVGAVEARSAVLVTGATGSLATAICALAKELDARVFGLSRRPAQIPAALSLDACLDVAEGGLADWLLDLTDGAGTDVAIDNVAEPAVFSAYLHALAPGGRVVFSGAIGTAQLPVLAVPAGLLYLRSLSLLGVRTATALAAAEFWEMVAAGFRFPEGLVNALPLEAASDAHVLVSDGGRIGHTVLVME